MALSDVGSLNANSSSKTPVSAIRLDAVWISASCPVATRREDTLGMPYVCALTVSRVGPDSISQKSSWASCLEERKDNGEAKELWKF